MLDVHLLRLQSHEISSSPCVTCCSEQANRAAVAPHERSLHLSARTPRPSIHNPALIIDLTLLMRSHRRSEAEIKINFRCFPPRESKINEFSWRRNFTKVQCLNNCLQSFWRNKTLVTQWETSSPRPCSPQPQTDGRKIYLTYVTNFVALCCALKCIYFIVSWAVIAWSILIQVMLVRRATWYARWLAKLQLVDITD